MEIMRQLWLKVKERHNNGVGAVEGHTNQMSEGAEEYDKKAEFMNKQQLMW